MKIGAIIMIVFFLVSLMGSIGGAVYYYLQSVEVIEEEVFEHLDSVAQSRASHVDSTIKEWENIVGTLASGIAFRGAVDESKDYNERMNLVNIRISSLIESHPAIQAVKVVDKDGIIIASNMGDESMDKSADDFFLKAKQSTYLANVMKCPICGKFVLIITSPIILEGEFAGIILVAYNMEVLNEITLDKTGIGETGETYLINKESYALTSLLFEEDAILKFKIDSINSRSCIGGLNNSEVIRGEHVGHEAVVIFLDYMGEKVIGSHHVLQSIDWCLLAEMNEEEILSSQRQLFQISSFLVILIITGFSTLVGFFFGKFLEKNVVLRKGRKRL